MSEESVEFVAGIFEAADGMDREALLAALPDLVPQLCDPDVEWIEDPSRADSRTYRGHAGVIESTGTLSEAPVTAANYAVITVRDGRIRPIASSMTRRWPSKPPG
jgi:ketosteroid isomerase-like protein